MARAIPVGNVDPKFEKQKAEDEEWLLSLKLIRQLTEEEKQAEEDHLFAARLAGIELNPVDEHQRSLAMLLDDRDDDDEEIDKPNQKTVTPFLFPTTTSVTTPKTPAKEKKCASCLDPVNDRNSAVPCGHFYHTSCLKELFLAAMQDESLMPPRCCGKEIPLLFVPMSMIERKNFDDKHLEFTTVNRLYCYKATCSTFIPPKAIENSVGTCPKFNCRATTCAICKAASHGNSDCPKDTETATILEQAAEEGWSRCYRCRALVELAYGCYHMTCRCRAEFCYLCKVQWKNCQCPQWDEQRLLDEARVRTVRIQENEGGRPLRPFQFQQQVQQLADLLRENEECRHNKRWIYVRGSGACEECRHFLPSYLFRCSGCQLMACNRCRRNRFT